MTPNKLNNLLLTACLVGILYLFYQYHAVESGKITICFIKNTTGFPCPSCGTTRAVLEILKGNILNSIWINPFGIIICAILMVSPFWIVWDKLFQQQSLFLFYRRTEQFLRNPFVYIPLLLLVVLNWVWNILKNN